METETKNNEGYVNSKNSFWLKLDKIKQYLGLIIFLPTLLGGLWQVIVLSQFGLSYIRFFSISQLLSDGLIILLFLPFIALFIFIIYHIFLGIKNNLKKNRKPYLITVGILFILIYLYLFFWGKLGQSSYTYQPVIEFGIGVVSLFCSLIFFDIANRFGKAFSYLIDRLDRLNLKKSDYEIAYQEIKNSKINLAYIPFPYFGIVSFLLFLGLTLKSIFTIGDYYIPDNLYNTETVINNVENKYKFDSADFEIKYFNDKYIFIEHYLLNKEKRDSVNVLNDTLKGGNRILIPKKILVLKSDVFFEEVNLYKSNGKNGLWSEFK